MDKITLGHFLSELREEHNITQEALAEILGISSYKTISKWECGNATPDLITLMKLAEVYDVSLYEFSIGKRINNPLISKNDIKRIINDKSIRKFIILKILLIISLILFLFYAIFSIAYTNANYNEVKIYDLKSADNEIYVDGFLIETNKYYYLSISNIRTNSNSQSFFNNVTNKINYSITINNYNIQSNKIDFQYKIKINEALLNIKSEIIDKTFIKNSFNHFYLNVNYRNEKNEEVNKSFKIILKKEFANNKIFY